MVDMSFDADYLLSKYGDDRVVVRFLYAVIVLRAQVAAAEAEQERLREACTEAERLVYDAGTFIECWAATHDATHAHISVSRRLLRNFLASHEALRAALATTTAGTET